LSAEPVLRRPIYQTLFKRGVGAALVAAQRRSLQTPRRILSVRGTRNQYSNDNENKFHGVGSPGNAAVLFSSPAFAVLRAPWFSCAKGQ
jgi:hypothetical protein